MSRIREAFWIWGHFCESETFYLNNLKNEVQKKLKSPQFEIHLTLTGPYINFNQSFRNSLSIFSKKTSTFSIKLEGYNFKEEFYRSFFISIKDNVRLNNLRDEIYRLNPYGLNFDYKPHLSLAYGNHSYRDKEKLVKALPFQLDSITLDRISIVKVNELKSIWKVLETFKLNKTIRVDFN